MTGTTTSTLELARASYRGLSLYAPDRTPCAIDLSDNTNLWGVPPAAERAIREAAVSTVTRYPALYAAGLKHALANYVGVAPDMIVTGCGSDDVLDSAIRAFAEPGDRVAYPDPSFAMIPIFARLNGLEPVAVPLEDDCDLDADAMLATRARIIYLCSPNNPTSNALSRAAIERVIANAPGIVMLDEAYAEFAGASGIDLIAQHDRLLVTRTLSKAFGLAGLRIGYAVGTPALVAEVEKSRGPYKVNALAERAAVAALTDDMPWVRGHIAHVIDLRERLAIALRERGFTSLPSASNFLLLPTARAGVIAGELRRRGVAVRPFERLPGAVRAFYDADGGALRVTVGPWAMMEQFLAAFDEAIA